jgi:hypothetical protein
LNPPRLKNVVKLLAQELGRLAMEDVEDRPTDRLVARNTLHAGLSLPVPCMNPVIAIDDVEAHR